MRVSSKYVRIMQEKGITHLPSSQGVATVQMKNWLPFVLGPALAMLKMPDPVCLNLKFSSGNFSP